MTSAELVREAHSVVQEVQCLITECARARHRVMNEFQEAKIKIETEHQRAVDKLKHMLDRALAQERDNAETARGKVFLRYREARDNFIAKTVNAYFPSFWFTELFFSEGIIRERNRLAFQLEKAALDEKLARSVTDKVPKPHPSRCSGRLHVLLAAANSLSFGATLKIGIGVGVVLTLLGIAPFPQNMIQLVLFAIAFVAIPFLFRLTTEIAQEMCEQSEIAARVPDLLRLLKQCEQESQKIIDWVEKREADLQKQYSQRLQQLRSQHEQRLIEVERNYLRKLREIEERFFRSLESQKARSEDLIRQANCYCPLWESSLWEHWRPGSLQPGLVRLGWFALSLEGFQPGGTFLQISGQPG